MAIPNFNSPYCIEKRRLWEDAELRNKTENQQLPPPYRKMDMILFPEGSLRNANYTVISEEHLKGKSVALYFGDGNDPKCKSFLPFLLQFYRTINESGAKQKIEIIFVSCDQDVKSFNEHISHMPWLHINLEDPLTDILRKHFRVMKEYEIPLYGSGPRTGVPCLIVIGSDGKEEQFLHISGGRQEGERGILRWDWRNSVFTANDLTLDVLKQNGKQQICIAKKEHNELQYPEQATTQRCTNFCNDHCPKY